jgi:hypothetical protein
MRRLFCLLSILFESFPEVWLACRCNFFLNLEMKVEKMIVKSVSVTMVASILMVAACSKNNEILNSTDVENVSTELLSEACVAEASVMSFAIFSNFNDTQLGSTLTSIPDLTSIDSLLTGASIAISGTGGINSPQGTITIDFKTGTTDLHHVLRKGKVNIKYSGRRWAIRSSHTISFSGFSRNNVKLDDSTKYTITNTDSSGTTRDFHHVLKGCQLIFPDKTTFKRHAEFMATIDTVSKITTLLVGDTINNGGTTRYGARFFMNITKPVIYKSQCVGSKIYLPSEGTKSIVVGSSTYTVIYGSIKTCGQTVKITAGGKSTTITVNPDGN